MRNIWKPCENTPPNELRFIPGAKDGIGIFHSNTSSPEEVAEEIMRLIQKIWKVEKPTFAAKMFSKERSKQDANDRSGMLIRKNSTISFIDTLLTAIRKNHDNIDIQNMIQYASTQAFESNEEELVKLGIALLGLIDLTKSFRYTLFVMIKFTS